ncbi:MAG: helix-turn-helix domain-containing protein [Candidatus Borkfalkia sp.]
MEVKDIIRNRRLELDLTLEQIAQRVGVSKPTVMRWENGDIENMRADKIAKLAKALNTTPVYLMGWTDEKEIMDLGNNAKDDLTSKEQELLEAFRRLLPEMQNFILESVKNLTSVKKLTLDKSE